MNDGRASLNDGPIKLSDRVRRLEATRQEAQRSSSPFAIPTAVLDAVREALAGGETHYTSRPGIPALRARVASDIARRGGPAYDPAAGIVITTGERESLFITLLGLRVPPGDVLVAANEPIAYADLLAMLDLNAVSVTGAADRVPAIRVSYRELEADVDAHARIIAWSASGQFPDVLATGSCIGSHGTRILSRIGSEQTIVLGGLDALPGVAALGVGFVAGPPSQIKAIRAWKQAFSICTAAPSQRAALAAWPKELQ